jgi:hypothetical protein
VVDVGVVVVAAVVTGNDAVVVIVGVTGNDAVVVALVIVVEFVDWDGITTNVVACDSVAVDEGLDVDRTTVDASLDVFASFLKNVCLYREFIKQKIKKINSHCHY